jgi:hypothetical protein
MICTECGNIQFQAVVGDELEGICKGCRDRRKCSKCGMVEASMIHTEMRGSHNPHWHTYEPSREYVNV